MNNQYPRIINNGHGDEITFLGVRMVRGRERLEVKGVVDPGAGAPMHVHHQQEEVFIIVNGKMETQLFGEEPKTYSAGDKVVFPAGTPHRFINPGPDKLEMEGWVEPANNVEFFLSEIYRSSVENGGRPGLFDSAWLLNRYRSEFDMLVIPALVKKFIFPVVRWIGTLAGKANRFRNAPDPL
ncbi:MAG: cupin domain-containing protein [Saprospiraceae bacterium]